jgi:hypothetical protein
MYGGDLFSKRGDKLWLIFNFIVQLK